MNKMHVLVKIASVCLATYMDVVVEHNKVGKSLRSVRVNVKP